MTTATLTKTNTLIRDAVRQQHEWAGRQSRHSTAAAVALMAGNVHVVEGRWDAVVPLVTPGGPSCQIQIRAHY